MAIVANTRLFNVRSALDYYNPVKDISNNQFYVFTARNTPWPNTSPLTMTDTVTEVEYQIFEEIIFGKHIMPEDVKQMIDRYDWVSGTVYAMYDDDDANLYDKNFFVVSYESGAYHVFKCLDNFGGIASTSQPLFSQTIAGDAFYVTADGYHWKYMYSIDTAVYNKFTTTDYIPVVVNNSVTSAAVNGSINAVLLISGGNNYSSYANGYFTGISVNGNTQTHKIGSASGNVGFYTGSALYISAGTGAGQVREITNYNVIGSQYLVTVNSVFSPQPDLTSQYQIAPNVKIVGDGTGAVATAIVDTGSKSITRISVVNTGQDYTYANVYIIGNTGTLQANSAHARAIVSPHGGHGANVAAELSANKLGFSVTFANTESGNISTQNDFSRIGLLKDPTLANIELTVANSVLFTDGEAVVQYVGVNTALNTFSSQVNQYVYNTQNFVKLNLSAATTLAVNDSIYQITPSIANGVVTQVSGNTVLVRQDVGLFSTSATILKLGNTSVNNTISTITSGFTDTVFGLDSSNVSFTWSASNDVDVYINDSKIYNKAYLISTSNAASFSVNSTAIQLYNMTLANTDLVTVHKYIQTAVMSNVQYTATGTVVSSNSTVVKLTDVQGQFITSANVHGLTSGYTNTVTAFAGPSAIFNQTLKLSGVQSGTLFVLDDYCQQNNGAHGYIHSIDAPVGVGNTTYNFYLTGVKGTFVTGTTIESANGDKIASISDIKQPDLVKYTGDIVYVENITAVSRSNTQSEKVQLVIKFY